MNTTASTTMKVSLPVELRSAAVRLSKKSKYSTVSGFIQHLIRREDAVDRERKALRKMLQVGLESGISDTPPDVFFDNLEKRIRAKGMSHK